MADFYLRPREKVNYCLVDYIPQKNGLKNSSTTGLKWPENWFWHHDSTWEEKGPVEPMDDKFDEDAPTEVVGIDPEIENADIDNCLVLSLQQDFQRLESFGQNLE